MQRREPAEKQVDHQDGDSVQIESMCGRYTIRHLADFIRATPSYLPPFEEFDEKRIIPRFNVAPGQQVPLVRINGDGKAILDFARWGLIPFWTKGKPKMQPINARDDKVLQSPMFKGTMERRRCLIAADGFYEWKGAKPPKIPYFFRLKDDAPVSFAGLWERRKPDPDSEDAEVAETCLHITTTPNKLVRPVHDRMPVILHPEDYARWLDRDVSPAEAAKLLKPYPAEEMEAVVVSTRVNKVGNEGPELIEPEESR